MEYLTITLTDRGSEPSILDLGTIPYAKDLPRTFKLHIINSLDSSMICVESIKFDDSNSPAYLFIRSLDDNVYHNQDRASSSAASSRFDEYHDISLNSLSILILPLSSHEMELIFQPCLSETDHEHPRTSYFTTLIKASISYSVQKVTSIETKSLVAIHKSLSLPDFHNHLSSVVKILMTQNVSIYITLCTSLLYIRETELDIGECYQGESSYGLIQVWNRSECPLEYRIRRQREGIDDRHEDITFTMYAIDSGKRLFPSDEILTLSTFASEQIKVAVSAKACGHYMVKFYVENVNNPNNRVQLVCKFNVINKLLEELSDSSRHVSYSINFGNCYFDRMQSKRLFLVNKSNYSAQVRLSTDSISEVFMIADKEDSHFPADDICEDFSKKVYESIEKNILKPELGEFKMTLASLNERIGLSKLNILPESSTDEFTTPPDDYPLLSTPKESPFQRLSSLWSMEGSIELKQNAKFNEFRHGKSYKSHAISVTQDVSTSCSYMFGYDYTLSNSIISPRKQPLNSTSELSYLNIWYRQQETFGRKLLKSNQFKFNKSFKQSQDNQKHHSKEAIKISDLYNFRYVADNQTMLPAIDITMSPASTVPIVVFYRPATSETIGQSKLNDVCSLRQKTFRISVAWASYSDEPDSMPDELSLNDSLPLHSQNYRLYSFKCHCCTSVVTVSPHVQNLGDCSVGEFYSTTFVVENHSDLAASIVPYLESETLSTMPSQTKLIPPHESLIIRFDYVAQVENTNYHRKILFFNELNPKNHHLTEVQARNIDTQHVLEHSKYYKIYTDNNKRQLQVFYDLCVMNMPNVRKFRIKNVSKSPISIQLFHDKGRVNGMSIFVLHAFEEHVNSANYDAMDSSVPDHLIEPIITDFPFEQSVILSAKSFEDLRWCSPRSKPKLSESVSSESLNYRRPRSFSRSDMIIEKTYKSNEAGNITKNVSGSFDIDYVKRSRATILQKSFSDNGESIRLCKSVGNLTEVEKSMKVPSNTLQYDNSKLKMTSSTLFSQAGDDSMVQLFDFMSIEGYPFSILEDKRKISAPTGASPSDIQQLLEQSIRSIQRSYQRISVCLSSDAPPFASRQRNVTSTTKVPDGGTIHILPGSMVNLAVVLTPASSDQDTNDLNINSFSCYVHLRLIPSYSESVITLANDLMLRSLLVRGKLCRSEMNLLQRNINFGKLTIGETSTKNLTIVNRSAIPLIYIILKSGSISSGFLKIPSGRRGNVAPKSSSSIEFVFKPALAGPFEETIEVVNILDKNNSQRVVVKAKVMKAEIFRVSSPVLNIKSLVEPQLNSIGEGGSINLGLGSVCTQLPYSFSFSLENLSNRKRQFIIDANHSDAVNLDYTDAIAHNEAGLLSARFNLDLNATKNYVQNVVMVRCRFELMDVRPINFLKLTDDEKQRLEDNLEKFNQKLKIAVRKNKQDKIQKYERKVKAIADRLSGKSDVAIDDIDDDLDDDTKMKDKLIVSNIGSTTANDSDASDRLAIVSNFLPQNKSPLISAPITAKPAEIIGSSTMIAGSQYIVNSDVSLHLELDAETIATISVHVTFIPSSSYRPWTDTLPFKGCLRVFEAKNEDDVKNIWFSTYLLSKKPIDSDISNETIKNIESDSESPRSSLLFPQTKLASPSITRFRSASEVMIATVAQYSSYPTKLLFPDYRILSQNILGMSLKLVPIDRNMTMQGSLYVDSLLFEDAILDVHVMSKWTIPSLITQTQLKTQNNGVELYSASDISYYNEELHGNINLHITTECKDVSTIDRSQNTAIQSVLRSGRKVEFVFTWSPNANYGNPKIIVTCICIQCILPDSISVQYVPLVCFLEKREKFRVVDKYVNFGEIHAGSSKIATASIENTSDDDLHYFTSIMYNSSRSTSRQSQSPSVGVALLRKGRTGVIPPRSSAQISVQFNANSVAGRFEQDLWIINMIDRTDQKRISLLANVVVDVTSYISFPDLENENRTEKIAQLTIDLGLIQISPANLTKSTKFGKTKRYHYILRIRNKSPSSLYVTAASNLKHQCTLYANEECTIPVVKHLLASSAISNLYLKIRSAPNRSSSSNQDYQSSASSNISLVGRELVGGIRMDFFTDSCEDNSFLETSINFKALVGMSLMSLEKFNQIAYSNSSMILNANSVKKVRFDQLAEDEFALIESSFRVENKSSTFPLHIETVEPISYVCVDSSANYLDKIKKILESCSMTSGVLIVLLFETAQLETCALNLPTLTLHGNQSVTLRIGVVYNRRTVSGLLKYKLNFENINTGDLQSLNFSFFIDPCIMANQFRNIAEHQILNNEQASIDVNSDGVIFIAPKTLPQETKISGSDVLTNQTVEVIGSTRKILCSWISRNLLTSPITVTPVSDLPVIVSIIPQLDNINSDAESSNFRSIHTTVRREDKTHRSLFSLTPGHWKGGLFKCGDSVTIREQASVRVVVIARNGESLRDSYILDSMITESIITDMLNGISYKGVGIVGFVNSNQALHSFFEPVPTIPRSLSNSGSQVPFRSVDIDAGQRKSLPNSNNSSEKISQSFPSLQSLFTVSDNQSTEGLCVNQPETLEVVAFSKVSVVFTAPKLRIISSQIRLGSVKCGKSVEFPCDVENLTDIELPITLEGFPSWISLKEDTSTQILSAIKTYYERQFTTEPCNEGHGSSSQTSERRMANTILQQNQSVQSRSSQSQATKHSSDVIGTSKLEVSKGNNSLWPAEKIQMWLESSNVFPNSESARSNHFRYEHSNSESDAEFGNHRSTPSSYSNGYQSDQALFAINQDGNMVVNNLADLSMRVAHMSVFLDSPSKYHEDSEGQILLTVEDIYERRMLFVRTTSRESILGNERIDEQKNTLKFESFEMSQDRIFFENEFVAKRSALSKAHKTFELSIKDIIIFIPPKSVYSIKLKATAPRVASQVLEHQFTINNVAASIGKSAESYGNSQIGNMSFDNCFFIGVKVQIEVDSLNILDVSSAAGRSLNVSGPKSTPFINLDRHVVIPPSPRGVSKTLDKEEQLQSKELAKTKLIMKNVSKLPLLVMTTFQFSGRWNELTETVVQISDQKLVAIPGEVDICADSENVDSLHHRNGRIQFVELMPGEEADVNIVFCGKLGTRLDSEIDILPFLFDMTYRGLLVTEKKDHVSNAFEIYSDNELFSTPPQSENSDSYDEFISDFKDQETNSLCESYAGANNTEKYGRNHIDLISGALQDNDMSGYDISTAEKVSDTAQSPFVYDGMGKEGIVLTSHRRYDVHRQASPFSEYTTGKETEKSNRPYKEGNRSVTGGFDIDSSTAGGAIDKSIGPILLGKFLMRGFEIVGQHDTQRWLQENLHILSAPHVASQGRSTDTIVVDVVTRISPQPILQLTSVYSGSPETKIESVSSGSNIQLNLLNDVNDDIEFCLDPCSSDVFKRDDDAPTGVPLLVPRFPFLICELTNFSDHSCTFSIETPTTYRHPNMRVILPNQDTSDRFSVDEIGYYDSFRVVAIPPNGSISAKSSIRFHLQLVPGFPNDATLLLSTLGLPINQGTAADVPKIGFSYLIGKAVVSIIDDSTTDSLKVSADSKYSRMHPPLVLQVNFTSSTNIAIVPTAPVSFVNRSKQLLNESNESKILTKMDQDVFASLQPDKYPLPKRSNSISKSGTLATVRMRGATPSKKALFSRIYDVKVGQHIQKIQFLEWIITLENRSHEESIQFRIIASNPTLDLHNVIKDHIDAYYVCVSPTDVKSRLQDVRFVYAGQPKGIIRPNDSMSVMLYCYRKHLGNHATYLIMENISVPGDIHLLTVLMDIKPPAYFTINDGSDDFETPSLESQSGKSASVDIAVECRADSILIDCGIGSYDTENKHYFETICGDLSVFPASEYEWKICLIGSSEYNLTCSIPTEFKYYQHHRVSVPLKLTSDITSTQSGDKFTLTSYNLSTISRSFIYSKPTSRQVDTNAETGSIYSDPYIDLERYRSVVGTVSDNTMRFTNPEGRNDDNNRSSNLLFASDCEELSDSTPPVNTINLQPIGSRDQTVFHVSFDLELKKEFITEFLKDIENYHDDVKRQEELILFYCHYHPKQGSVYGLPIVSKRFVIRLLVVPDSIPCFDSPSKLTRIRFPFDYIHAACQTFISKLYIISDSFRLSMVSCEDTSKDSKSHALRLYNDLIYHFEAISDYLIVSIRHHEHKQTCYRLLNLISSVTAKRLMLHLSSDVLSSTRNDEFIDWYKSFSYVESSFRRRIGYIYRILYE